VGSSFSWDCIPVPRPARLVACVSQTHLDVRESHLELPHPHKVLNQALGYDDCAFESEILTVKRQA
jgi:hypothetical protein